METGTEAEALLALALERPAAERDAFLDAACAGRPELRRELGALLPHAEAEPAFLGSPALKLFPPDPAALLGLGGAEERGHPERIGGCRIVRVLGYGGMGVVYEARQDEPERPVAVKLLGPGPATPALRRRFAVEARLLARLDHPGIVRLFAAGEQEVRGGWGPRHRLPFLVLELVRGEHLDRHAAGLPPAARLRLFARVCDAVHHAHERGVVHRDLKPANILVRSGGRPKIVDFGIALDRQAGTGEDGGPSSRLTQPGQVLGSLSYMSPEQLDGDPRRVDARSDVYALGVILYELLAGGLPHPVGRLSPVAAAERIRGARPAPAVPGHAGLSGVAGRALAADPEARWASAAELAAEVRRAVRGFPPGFRLDR